jgi:hypothetical protein
MGFQEWIKGFTYRSGFQNMDSILRSSFVTDLAPITVTKSSRQWYQWNFIFKDEINAGKDDLARNIFGKNEYLISVYDEKGNAVGKMKWIAATLSNMYIHATVIGISPDSFPIKVGYRIDFSKYYNPGELQKIQQQKTDEKIQNNEENIQRLGDMAQYNDTNQNSTIQTLKTNLMGTNTDLQNAKRSTEKSIGNQNEKIETARMNISDLEDKTSNMEDEAIEQKISMEELNKRIYDIENYGIENFTTSIQQGGYSTITGAQQRLINITEQEKDRLDNIHQNYRDQDDNRDKMQMLMLSEKDKQNKYMLLAVIFAFVFVVAFFFTYIQNVKKNKSVWFDIIMVLLIAAALIYALVVYVDIQNRDPNNFSKLAPDSDSLLVVETRTGDGKHGVKYGIAATTDLQGGGCKGDACCGPGSYWNESSKRCIQKV